MLGIGTASVLAIGLIPNLADKIPFKMKNDYSYECTTGKTCYYLLKNEAIAQILKQPDIEPTIEIIHSFVNDLIENSMKSPSHFSKTVDKHFWNLA